MVLRCGISNQQGVVAEVMVLIRQGILNLRTGEDGKDEEMVVEKSVVVIVMVVIATAKRVCPNKGNGRP